MYQQIDGVAIGSPLGPALANIFEELYKQLLFGNTSKPLLYFRYVDNIFGFFSNKTECNEFLQKLNSLHSTLVFTFAWTIRDLNPEAIFLCSFNISSSSSSFEEHPLQARHKQNWGRGFILLLSQTAALPGSDAGSDVIKPASSFVI